MNCEDAILYYYDYLHKTGAIAPDAVDHLEKCPICQDRIDSLRQALHHADVVEKPWRPHYLDLHYQFLDQWVGCDAVRPLLPSLLIGQLSVTGPTPVTAHIDRCPNCRQSLEKVAALGLSPSALLQAGRYLADHTTDVEGLDEQARRVLDAIGGSEPSHVLTRMRLTEADETQLQSKACTVDVKHRHAAAVVARHTPRRRAVSAWVAGGVAAAVLFAIMVVLPAGDVQAVDVHQLYMTLDTVRNVHIQKYNDAQQLETIWISEGLGAYLFTHPDDVYLVTQQTGNIYRQHQGTVQLVSRGGKMELERPWGLLPFKSIAELPASYEWEYMSDTELENGLHVRIYEWRWTETVNDRLAIQHIWRGYLDAGSYLPYRIESLDKVGDAPQELIMEMRITYPSDEECRRVFREYGFEGLVYGIQNGAFSKFPSLSNDGSTEDGFALSTWPSAKTALNVPE